MKTVATPVAMNVTVALLSALVVLPPILVWADAEGRNWVSRGLVHKEEPVFIEYDREPAKQRAPQPVPILVPGPVGLWAEPGDAPGPSGNGPSPPGT